MVSGCEKPCGQAHGVRLRRVAGVLLMMALLGSTGASRAQTATEEAGAQDCARAAWSLAGERALLAAPDARVVESGDRLALPLSGAVVLRLGPRDAARLPFPPTRAGQGPDAGFLRLEVPPPGAVWQITVSASSWIDVHAEGRPLEPVAFTGVRSCPGVRKSLRFRLPAGEAVLTISDAEADRIALILAPAVP